MVGVEVGEGQVVEGVCEDVARLVSAWLLDCCCGIRLRLRRWSGLWGSHWSWIIIVGEVALGGVLCRVGEVRVVTAHFGITILYGRVGGKGSWWEGRIVGK